MILVIGGTGTTGRAVLQALRGVPTRALVRGSGNLPPGVGRVVGDAGDLGAVRAALTGVSRVFLAMGNGPRQEEIELGVVAEAARAGVDHLVKVSAPGPVDSPVAIARLHHRVEEAVRESGIGHTFLRPYAFFQNLLFQADRIRATGSFPAMTGDTPLNMVDARDVADVAVAALAGKVTGTHLLTGPEAVSYPEVAARLTALGRPTRCVAVAAEELRADLRGAPDWLVDHVVEIQRLAITHPEHPNDTVAHLLGRPPRRLDDFLRQHAVAFGTDHSGTNIRG
ncbi:NAD(P)H-binding protein [Actinokineospora enzanensis]|uniref:NAD(P)H-binding protein n=1 Tax=Actinokineospora enzanensis TaxID=155975 RepID=UPI0003637DB6|nr:NAD(P)H-binding protein [Actinokineospora enzanensis]